MIFFKKRCNKIPKRKKSAFCPQNISTYKFLSRSRVCAYAEKLCPKIYLRKTILHGFDKTRLLYFTFEGYTMSVQRKKYKRKIPITEKGECYIMKKFVSIMLAALLALALLAGCGSKDATTTTRNGTTAADGNKEVSGTVSTDGSTSMENVIGALGEAFMQNNKNAKFTYNPTGSGSGITAVAEGRCDIGLSSRALKDDEKANGLTETIVALDGIAVIVNPANAVSDLSVENIAKIYTGEITNWKDLGGADAEIVVIGREAGSGTRDGFESITSTKEACKYRQELTSTGDVITTVANNPNAIGYASLAALQDSVKALTVGGVAPSEATVKDGSYVIQRPFVLVTKTGTQLSEVAQKFFDFATSSEANDLISKAGAVPVK